MSAKKIAKRRPTSSCAKKIDLNLQSNDEPFLNRDCEGCSNRGTGYRKYKHHYFCPDCIELKGKKVVRVKCPKHKNWCSDTNSCPGCLADWVMESGWY